VSISAIDFESAWKEPIKLKEPCWILSSYYEVCAELDRYLVYSIVQKDDEEEEVLPLDFDTDDKEEATSMSPAMPPLINMRDTFQQYMAHQRTRTREYLPEHITIDQDLNDDQNEKVGGITIGVS
jgi:hypothetical protein